MNAESERHVRRIAVEPDLVGMLILLGIATGERNGQEHAITGLQLYARHLNVIGTDALMRRRRISAQHFPPRLGTEYGEIGRATCRERVCNEVLMLGGAVPL